MSNAEGLKEKIVGGLVIAAMWTPPWNLFWWGVGASLYYGTGQHKHDHSGDSALGMVFCAPVTLPAFPFLVAHIKYEDWKRRRAV